MNASDAAIKLDIAKDTLRAYSLELERACYEVKSNNRNQRDYSDYDILIFRAFRTLSKTHGLTLKEATSKVSSADFTPSIIEDNAVLLERLSTLETKQDMILKAIEHPKKSNEFKHMQEQMDTMIRNQTELAETTPNTNALIAEIRKLNSKIAELETLAITEQTKGGFWTRLFRN